MTVDELERLLAHVLASTNASRVTVRVDDAGRGWTVNDVVAEAVAPGRRSLKGMTAIDQRAADTARRIEQTRELLVQDDVSRATSRPPAALLELYGVRAQVLAPIEVEGDMVGWLSVHDCAGPHAWSAGEQAVIEAAAKAVEGGWPLEPAHGDGRD